MLLSGISMVVGAAFVLFAVAVLCLTALGALVDTIVRSKFFQGRRK